MLYLRATSTAESLVTSMSAFTVENDDENKTYTSNFAFTSAFVTWRLHNESELNVSSLSKISLSAMSS